MENLSKIKKVKAEIKRAPEDFLVQEITANGTILSLDKAYLPGELGFSEQESGKFVVFILQKRDWNTAQALIGLAKTLGRGRKSVSFAGTKDRVSVSTQLCSVFGAERARVASARLKDIRVNAAWYSDSQVRMGDLLGNNFSIKIHAEIDEDKLGDHIKRACEELDGMFPNYFGEQRFGQRKNNVEVGLCLLRGDFERAAMTFLTDTSNEINQDAVAARKRLAERMDFAEAMNYFPRYLKYERMAIDYLSKFPGNYANALRRLPRQLLLMFAHSVESQIFNEEVERRIKEHRLQLEGEDIAVLENFYGFPDYGAIVHAEDRGGVGKYFACGNIVGYDTKRLTDFESMRLDELGIKLEDFKLKKMPEINCKGTFRVFFSPFKDFSFENGAMQFSLPAGSYATTMMDEFFEV